MTTGTVKESSPIQKAIDNVVKTMGLRASFQCYVDWDQGNLEELAKCIIECSNQDDSKKILFIKSSLEENGKEAYQPWITLLESVIRETNTGVVANLFNVVPELLKHKLPTFAPIHKVDIGRDALSISPWNELETLGDIEEARRSVTAWAKLESISDVTCTPVFSHLAGGLRPMVAIFDDYNNYIQNNGGEYLPIDIVNMKEIAQRYGAEPNEFHDIVKGYCWNLNNLSISFEVYAPKLWVSMAGGAGYEQIVQVLPFKVLEEVRDRLCAFIVDLEWRPTLCSGEASTGDWSGMGYQAIYLLSQRFPEIVSFVFTGERPYTKLQEAVAHGASWCFRKPRSHHPFIAGDSVPLNYIDLERHLREAVKVRFGSFPDLPYPDQLIIEPREQASKKLCKQLRLQLPIGRCARGSGLQKLIAKLFPVSDSVRPAKVISNGKSKAQATFFARHYRNGIPYATRFIKIAPWLEIQREHLAYNYVINPRLNSYIANVIGDPVFADGIEGEMPIGAIVYSMAGLPEGYSDLSSLGDLLQKKLSGSDDGRCVAQRLRQTFEEVLAHLYGAGGNPSDSQVRQSKRPLWGWLGEVLPPTYTGVLVPMESLAREDDSALTLGSYKKLGYKDTSAWLMAANANSKINKLKKGDKNLSPWNLSGDHVVLSGFHLLEVDWSRDQKDTGDITLSHPDLGFRIRLRGTTDDIRRRFGAIWSRPGMPVDVEVCIDNENREINRIRGKLGSAIRNTGLDNSEHMDSDNWVESFEKITGANLLLDPFHIFCGEKKIPFYYTINAHEGPVHGDLNLQNILFSGEAGPGWLIDFERADNHGMLAFDLAKLEIEVWHHHVFPVLEDLASGQSGDKGECCLKLLELALSAVDAASESSEIFASRVRSEAIITQATNDLFLPIDNLFEVISQIRKFGAKLHLLNSELRWALAAYSLIATKFASDDQPWRAIFSFYISAWHLGKVAPRIDGTVEASREKLFADILEAGTKATSKQLLDGFLIEMVEKPVELDRFTMSMAKSRDGCLVEWPKKCQCVDLASTGSITNITPIFGYLWLMVKSLQSRDKSTGEFSVVVPKISSPGASCGTVDILESGGLRFPGEPEAIKKACLRDGGVLCRQHDSLTPIDMALMNRRKKTNTMKNVAQVYASILSKKIAMGCTDVIVDVKVGRDSKILGQWVEEEENKLWLGEKTGGPNKTDQDGARLMCPEMRQPFKTLLTSDEMLGEKASVRWDEDQLWVEQTCDVTLRPLTKVRWFFTNADMPQCRAIGRQITLLHLDDLILGTYGDELLDNSKDGDSEYTNLYMKFLPEICEVTSDSHDQLWVKLQDQWRLLKSQLSLWDRFSVTRLFVDLRDWREERSAEKRAQIGMLAQNTFEQSQELEKNMDLMIMTLALGAYQPSAREGSSNWVRRIDAWRLDSLFEWLCGEESFDPEVGIYLHRLPGEEVKNIYGDPFISVCFRPSRTAERNVLEQVRCFLSEHVALVSDTESGVAG